MNKTRNAASAAEAARIELHHGDVTCIECGRGQRLRVERGSVWLTQHGSSKDLCLETGGTFRAIRSGRVVATAIGRRSFAVLTIEPSSHAASNAGSRMRRFWNQIFAPAAAHGLRAAH